MLKRVSGGSQKYLPMKKIFKLALACLICGLLIASSQAQDSGSKIRVLIVTGGHDFEQPEFFKTFNSIEGITCKSVAHPRAHEQLKAAAAKDWDVLLLYDMHQEITEEAKADFLARINEGKGLLVMHHAIASYQAWGDYQQIIGAHYYLAKTNLNGIDKARSAYKHGVDIPIKIANTTHPVTQGMTDYVIHDETYKWFDVYDGSEVLLRSPEPESSPIVAWARTYQKSRIVYLQSGHDHLAWDNPNFKKFVTQSIKWVARKN